jgi:hypothetical protein
MVRRRIRKWRNFFVVDCSNHIHSDSSFVNNLMSVIIVVVDANIFL